MAVSSKKTKPQDQELADIIYDRLLQKYNRKLLQLEYAVTRSKVKELIKLIPDKHQIELLCLLTVDMYKERFKPQTALHIGTISSIRSKVPVPDRALKYSLIAYKEKDGSRLQQAIDYWIGYWIDTDDSDKAIRMLEKLDPEEVEDYQT